MEQKMNKTKLYLIRHGESQANERDVFLGHTDLDLTARGKLQAQTTANYLKNFAVDKIYSSDLLRAYHTAKATADLLQMPIIKDVGLREIYCGAWENQPFALLVEQYPNSYGLWMHDIDNAYPDDGESVVELQNRVIKTIEKIAKENIGKTVLIFSHATPIRCFVAHCQKMKMKDIPWASNASVTEIDYENHSFNLIAYSKDDFLGDIITVLPDNT